MNKKIIFFLFFWPFFAIADEHSKNIDKLMTSFVDCNANFFADIYNYREDLQSYTNVQLINEHQAFIAVENRNRNDKNIHLFNKPINYKSLSITGYYDSAMNLGKYGNYYFWGFIIDNELDEIASSLSFLNWEKMEEDYLYISRPKIRYTDDSLETWHENKETFVGVKTVPAQGTAEKLLLLEKSPEITLLVCSIQGFFPPQLLQRERPDISK